MTTIPLTVSSAGIVVSGGNELDVDSPGGFATGATVLSGGSIKIFTSATGLTISSGGLDDVQATSGYESGTVINGGSGNVGAFATNDIVESGGKQTVYAAGSADYTTISSGSQGVYGMVLSETLSSGANMTVYAGGVADATTVSNHGSSTIYGSASGTIVLSGGYQQVYDGTATASVISFGGTEHVNTSGTSFNTVLNGGTQLVNGTTGVASGTIVNSYGGLFVGAEAFNAIVNAGTLTVYGGGMVSGTTIGAKGVEVISSGGVAEATTFLLGGTLDLLGLTFVSSGTATVSSGDQLTISQGGSSYTQTLAGTYTNEAFAIGSGTGGATVATLVPCYCRGTMILTGRGEVAIEELAAGDRLVTRTGEVRPLIWVGRRSYAGRFLAGNPAVLPVTISAGALADGMPHRDLRVSPLHAMYLDGVLIPAILLVNGASITQAVAAERVDYFHLELETHDVIIAEGAPSETFVDDEGRQMFHNASERPAEAASAAIYYAPRVESGYLLEAVRKGIAARAGTAVAA